MDFNTVLKMKRRVVIGERGCFLSDRKNSVSLEILHPFDGGNKKRGVVRNYVCGITLGCIKLLQYCSKSSMIQKVTSLMSITLFTKFLKCPNHNNETDPGKPFECLTFGIMGHPSTTNSLILWSEKHANITNTVNPPFVFLLLES